MISRPRGFREAGRPAVIRRVSTYPSDPDRVSDPTTEIQRVLDYNYEGNDNASGVDGWYGSRTRSGVIAFQQNHGLAADGIVGTYTWNKLEDDLVHISQTSGFWEFRVEGDAPVFFLLSKVTSRWYVESRRVGGFVPMDRSRS